MQNSGQIEQSYADHKRIILAIEKNDRARAVEELKDNWRHGIGAVLVAAQRLTNRNGIDETI